MRLKNWTIFVAAISGASCSAPPPPPPYGPYWTYAPVVPDFVAKQDSVSTSFNGRVFPKRHFVLGATEGFSVDKPNARLTVNATVVWQYAPIDVALYDGPPDAIGTPSALVTSWHVDPAPLGGGISFVESHPLSRTPTWAVVDFTDFSGSCILEVLGHD